MEHSQSQSQNNIECPEESDTSNSIAVTDRSAASQGTYNNNMEEVDNNETDGKEMDPKLNQEEFYDGENGGADAAGPPNKRMKRIIQLNVQAENLILDFDKTYAARVDQTKIVHMNMINIINDAVEKSLMSMNESRQAFINNVLNKKLEELDCVLTECAKEAEILNFIETEFKETAKRLNLPL